MKKIKLPIGNPWKQFTGNELPESFNNYFEKERIWRSGYAQWIEGSVYYKGETPETATEWTVALNDGGYYKVGAQFIFWHPYKDGRIAAHCSWSFSHLQKNLKSFLLEGKTIFDPQYTT